MWIFIPGTTTFVEDIKGDVELVDLYNFHSDLNDPSWLKKGTIMLIKEPYLKFAPIDKSAFIRVDSPSGIICLCLLKG
jgi:hypothetical protein